MNIPTKRAEENLRCLFEKVWENTNYAVVLIWMLQPVEEADIIYLMNTEIFSLKTVTRIGAIIIRIGL